MSARTDEGEAHDTWPSRGARVAVLVLPGVGGGAGGRAGRAADGVGGAGPCRGCGTSGPSPRWSGRGDLADREFLSEEGSGRARPGGGGPERGPRDPAGAAHRGRSERQRRPRGGRCAGGRTTTSGSTGGRRSSRRGGRRWSSIRRTAAFPALTAGGRGGARGDGRGAGEHRPPRADAGGMGRGPGPERPAGALHHRVQLGTADDPGRLQQQLPALPDPGTRWSSTTR